MINESIVKALTEVLRLKSDTLYRHSIEVARVAESLCHVLNINGGIAAAIRDAGYLHDLGKLGVKDVILQKPGELSGREWEQIKLHPVLSVEILKSLMRVQMVQAILA